MQTYSKSKDRWILRTTFTAHSTSLIYFYHTISSISSLFWVFLQGCTDSLECLPNIFHTQNIQLFLRNTKNYLYIYIALVKKNCQRAHINLKVQTKKERMKIRNHTAMGNTKHQCWHKRSKKKIRRRKNPLFVLMIKTTMKESCFQSLALRSC